MNNTKLLEYVEENFGVKILQFNSYTQYMKNGIFELDTYEFLLSNGIHYIRNTFDDDSKTANYFRIYKTNHGFYFLSERLSQKQLLKDIRALKLKSILDE